MKKICSLFLSVLLLLFSVMQTSAEKKDNSINLTCSGDSVRVSWSADISRAKSDFGRILSEALKQYTLEQIESVPSLSFLTKEVRLFLRFGYQGEYSCFPLDKDTGTITLSLYSDIIPGFPADADFSKGAQIAADLIPATEDYPAEHSYSFGSLSVKCGDMIDTAPTGRIIFRQAKGTLNSNPQCFALPLEKDIILTEPSLTGHIFAGWRSGDAACDRVRAGTENITVTADFTPCVYNIVYELTTDIHYSFGRADNSKNPKTYTYGEETPLYPVKSPVGGYSFFGWFRDGKAVTEIPAGTTGDVVLHAKWLTDEEMKALSLNRNYRELTEKGFCDLDGDGEVGVSDARAALRIAIGLDSATADIRERADVFGNGSLTVANARTILRIAIGLENIIEIYSAAAEARQPE